MCSTWCTVNFRNAFPIDFYRDKKYNYNCCKRNKVIRWLLTLAFGLYPGDCTVDCILNWRSQYRFIPDGVLPCKINSVILSVHNCARYCHQKWEHQNIHNTCSFASKSSYLIINIGSRSHFSSQKRWNSVHAFASFSTNSFQTLFMDWNAYYTLNSWISMFIRR